MTILKVNPTRVNLLSLKGKLKTARKGHKLLKNKRDGLIQRFMAIIKETQRLRESVDEELGKALRSYVSAAAMVNRKQLESALMLPPRPSSLTVATDSVMAVHVPRFTLVQDDANQSSENAQCVAYGFLETQGDMDIAIRRINDVFADLIKLAEQEKTIENLADEIEKTRRRTNALEYVKIPNLQETVTYINLRLEEQQRDAVVSSVLVKAMITENE